MMCLSTDRHDQYWRTGKKNLDPGSAIIVHDAVSDILAETTKAYKSIRKVKHRPVDIVVGTVSRFEARKEIPSIENEVHRKGVPLYDAEDYEAA